MTSYAASKAAVVRFTESLAHELKPHGIDVNAIAPGALDTRLLDQVLTAGPETVGTEFYERMIKVKRQGGTPLSVGAELVVYLASDASSGITGRLISAAWDKWSTLHERAQELDATDIYTLRRIVPADRGLGVGRLNYAHRHHRMWPDRPKAGRCDRRRYSDRDGLRYRFRTRPYAGRPYRRSRQSIIGREVMDSDIDAVVVATSHDSLAPIALAAVEAGKHVLVEKPAARNRT